MPANASTIEQLARAAKKYAEARARYYSYPKFKGNFHDPKDADAHKAWADGREALWIELQDREGDLLTLADEMYSPRPMS